MNGNKKLGGAPPDGWPEEHVQFTKKPSAYSIRDMCAVGAYLVSMQSPLYTVTAEFKAQLKWCEGKHGAVATIKTKGGEADADAL